MANSSKTGVLLINLGTPQSPEAKDVGVYLRQFLMDPFVIDIPAFVRWPLVNIAIVPRRSKASGELYQKIWTDRGSPLLFHTQDLSQKVQTELGSDFIVAPAMRYGQPSIPSALEKLKAAGASQFVAFPLYPQYSLAATESSVVAVKEAMEKSLGSEVVEFVPAFFNDEHYLSAVTEVSRGPLEAANADFVLFSFHGLPENQVKKTDSTRAHCLKQKDCCVAMVAANAQCYRAQSFATARELAKRLHIPVGKYEVTFQSRFTNRWIKPFTDDFYRTLPKQGIKRVAVLCPSFVADCLETLEEVQIRGNEEFRQNGGEEIILIPSLNSSDIWAKTVSALVRKHAV